MDALTRFTADWTAAQRRRAALLCSLVGLPLIFLVGPRLNGIFRQADVYYYLQLVARQPVMLPFASRQLGPLIVGGLVHAFGLSVANAFYLQGTFAMLLFFATTLWFLLRSGTPRFMIAATTGLLFWPFQFNSLALPDLLYAALLCLFLLLLQRERFLLAALVLLPLTVTRESTILTLACYLVAGWRRLRLTESLLALTSMAAGMLIVKGLTANALPNHEQIPPIAYLFAKMPWAFLKNFLGILPWSNVFPECDVPTWQMPLHLGHVQAVGTCGFQLDSPARLLFYALASFGLFPLLFLALRRFRKTLTPTSAPPRAELLLRFCVVYGVVSFLIAGLLGESFERLFAYSWPVFLVALPILLTSSRATFANGRAAFAFLALHLLLSWAAVDRYHPQLLPAEIAVWIAGWILLRRTLVAIPIITTPARV